MYIYIYIYLHLYLYITEAGSLDPMLEFARKPSEASNGGWRDPCPTIFKGTPHAKRKTNVSDLCFGAFRLRHPSKSGLHLYG